MRIFEHNELILLVSSNMWSIVLSRKIRPAVRREGDSCEQYFFPENRPETVRKGTNDLQAALPDRTGGAKDGDVGCAIQRNSLVFSR
jgi:hypothetical protein